MPVQNRVTPFGDAVAIPQRGIFTGNRGIIHDPATRTLLNRRWACKACLIEQCYRMFSPELLWIWVKELVTICTSMMAMKRPVPIARMPIQSRRPGA
jgi:hypothetical protein